MLLYKQNPAESAGDYAYRILRRNILQVNLVPGECIGMTETANELQVSKTPIQSAFSRLAADGLLDVLPQRGSYVSAINLKRVYESVYMRNLLDQATIHYLCGNKNKISLIELEANINRQQFSLDNGLLEEVMELDDSFHNIIYSLCDMDNIRKALESISSDQYRVRHMKLQSRIRWSETVAEHVELLDSIRKGDLDRAMHLSYEHVSRFGMDIDYVYHEHPDYFKEWTSDLKDQFVCIGEVFYNMQKK